MKFLIIIPLIILFVKHYKRKKEINDVYKKYIEDDIL